MPKKAPPVYLHNECDSRMRTLQHNIPQIPVRAEIPQLASHKRAGRAADKGGAEKGPGAHTRAELMPQITRQNSRDFSR